MKKETLSYTVLAFALALTGLGVALGQQEQVLAKAVRICMECVGIG